MTWAAWLVALVGPLAARVLSVLGMQVLVVSGITVAWSGLQTQLVAAWAGLPGAVLALASMAGVPQALGAILGAIAARVALMQVTNAARIVGKT